MEADRRDAGVRGQPQGEVKSLATARAEPRAELDGDGDSPALARRGRETNGEVRVGEKRGARARLADLADGAAHVDVDQVRARLGHGRGGGSHDLRILTEELDRDRVLSRVEPEELLQRAL